MSVVQVPISVVLRSEYWKDPPSAIVTIDQMEVIYDGVIDGEVIVSQTYSFGETKGEHRIEVTLYNKDSSVQTVVAPDGTVLKDQMLYVEDIIICGLNLEQYHYGISRYVRDYDKAEFTNTITLPWNGTWSMPFTTPIYPWLVKHL